MLSLADLCPPASQVIAPFLDPRKRQETRKTPARARSRLSPGRRLRARRSARTELAEHPDGELRRLHRDQGIGKAVVAAAVVQHVEQILRDVCRELAAADNQQRLPRARRPSSARWSLSAGATRTRASMRDASPNVRGAAAAESAWDDQRTGRSRRLAAPASLRPRRAHRGREG